MAERWKSFNNGANEQAFRNDLAIGAVDKIGAGGKWTTKAPDAKSAMGSAVLEDRSHMVTRHPAPKKGKAKKKNG
jgi:hypothetical protein